MYILGTLEKVLKVKRDEKHTEKRGHFNIVTAKVKRKHYKWGNSSLSNRKKCINSRELNFYLTIGIKNMFSRVFV